MVRYKRYRRKYKKSTNVIRMKFQSFMDIHTIADQMQIISISAGGENILKRLPFQFAAYKYYKIGNISIKLVPASTLPVDPTGLSIAAGDTTVDPRDQLTPGMMRITNGEDVFEDITGMSAANQRSLYNGMMLDPRWYKWSLQSGVKRHAKPRYWQIGQLHQDKWPGSVINMPSIAGTSPFAADNTAFQGVVYKQGTGVQAAARDASSSPYGLFQTGHKGVLGWLPTDSLQHIYKSTANGGDTDEPFIASPPTIEVFKLILPPAYKTEYWYRAYISETVYFRDPVQNVGVENFGSLDIFHDTSSGNILNPKLPSDGSYTSITDADTGGNYGDS